MAILPVIKVEAIAVMTIKFICWAPTAKERGIINRTISFKAGYLKLKRDLYLNPQPIAEGIWIAKYKNAPKITPIPTPKIPKEGAKNKIAKIIPRLYKTGATE